MSGRRVNFRESPPSSGVSSRYTSDSGHGSVSDYPGSSAGVGATSNGAASSRYSGGGGGVNQWTDLPALQEAYRTVLAERDDWKNRAEELETEVVEAQKQTSEAEAKWRAMVESNEQIEDEKKKLFKENKELKAELEDMEELQDDLKEQLAKTNARFNEVQHNLAPAYGAPGTSPHHHEDHYGHADTKSSSTSRHSKDGKVSSSSSNKSSSNAGSGTSSGGSSHSSSRAKVGSSSSTSTAKLSRSGSSRHGDHHPAKDQKARLSQRFDHKDDGLNDSNASASSAASSSSQKHHKSGSSGNGSSGSNGSSASAESVSMRPQQPRVRRGSYVEGYGPGPAALGSAGLSASQRPPNMIQTPISPNKGVPRSAQAPSVMGVAGGPSAGAFYAHAGYAPPPQAHQFSVPPSSSGLMSPRGEMSKDGMRPKVHIVSDIGLEPYQDPNYYSGYPSARDPRSDPRLPRR